MTEVPLYQLLLKVLGTLLVILANSLVVAVTEHPQDAPGLWGAFLRALGRASVLRHRDAPGTLHLPGRAQPAPDIWIPKGTRGKASGGLVALLVMLGSLAGCRASLEPTERALAAALRAQTSAVGDFAVWDRQHQVELVARAKTRAEAQVRLQEYRASRARIRELLLRSSLALDTAIVTLGFVPPPPAPVAAPAPAPAAGGGR
jgi:hypothetical protein